jgi:hypothetical protein
MLIIKCVNFLIILLLLFFLFSFLIVIGILDDNLSFINIFCDLNSLFKDIKYMFTISLFFPMLFFIKVIICLIMKHVKKYNYHNELIEKIIFNNLILIGIYFFLIVLIIIYGISHIQINFG